MGYEAYAVTVGLDVGVFDDWLIAAAQVLNLPKGSQAIWKGYKTYVEAQNAYDNALNRGYVSIINPTTGLRTAVKTGSVPSMQQLTPPSNSRLTPPPTPDISSVTALSSVRNRNVVASSIATASTATSPPTGITQYVDLSPYVSDMHNQSVTSPSTDASTHYGPPNPAPPCEIRRVAPDGVRNPRKRSVAKPRLHDMEVQVPGVSSPIASGLMSPLNFFEDQHVLSAELELQSSSSSRVKPSPRAKGQHRSATPKSVYTITMPTEESTQRRCKPESPGTPSSPRRRKRRSSSALRISAPASDLSSSAPSHESPSPPRSRDELLALMLGSSVNITPRRRGKTLAKQSTYSPSQSTQIPTVVPEPGSSRFARGTTSARMRLDTPPQGSLAFSDSDMDAVDICSDEGADNPGTDNESERCACAPRFLGLRRAHTDPTTSNIICGKCDRPGFLFLARPPSGSRSATGRTAASSSREAAAPPSRTTMSASGSSNRPNYTRLKSPGLDVGRASLSPAQQQAVVHSPLVDPRSPIRSGSTSVPNSFSNGNALHFGRPTPPQSFPTFESSTSSTLATP